MNKNVAIKLLISSMFLIIISSLFCSSSSYALGDLFSEGKEFLKDGNSISETINTTKLEETSNDIYNTLLAIGVMVAVIEVCKVVMMGIPNVELTTFWMIMFALYFGVKVKG